MELLFNVVTVLLIFFIIYWFWIAKAESTKVTENTITILVKDGVYKPNRIEMMQPDITLNFIRKDATPCAEYVIFDQLDIHEQLPLNKVHAIKLHHINAGRYVFTCQMGMYQGELMVKPRDDMKE